MGQVCVLVLLLASCTAGMALFCAVENKLQNHLQNFNNLPRILSTAQNSALEPPCTFYPQAHYQP
jgi:hypothetical protein